MAPVDSRFTQMGFILISVQVCIRLPHFVFSRYHSIFACPILRQQTSDANPPLKLTCGHCISRDALNKLSSNAGHKLKCPYCPVEQNPGDARQIYL